MPLMYKKAITIEVILVLDIQGLQDKTKFEKYLKRGRMTFEKPCVNANSSITAKEYQLFRATKNNTVTARWTGQV